jgi:hypothetical protein
MGRIGDPLAQVRPLLPVLAACLVAACGSGTPECSDGQAQARVVQMASSAIEDALKRADPKTNPVTVLSRIKIAPPSVSAARHDKDIDKWTCSAELRIRLPSQIGELNAHPVFKAIVAPRVNVAFRRDQLAVPVSYTLYRSRENNELVVSVEGLDAAAKYIQGVYRAGAFSLDLQRMPDLRSGLVLYSARDRHLLIRPAENGALQFDFTYDKPVCRPWTQYVTEERGDVLIYSNPAARCSLTFSRLGELLLVEHTGCELMNPLCLPDGVYRKQ